ncbi:MAG: hypothetical protein K9N23_08865 [Akkermansiaceae bacterium]|nr:hypothetical protein [Akkermansiaceae bacterium]
MIPYQRDRQQTIPSSSVKIVGLGGAGANMLERVALDGTEGAELLALNTDARTLAACVAGEKIQLGRNLTKGLGAGGDPDLGHQAILESEEEIRLSLRGRRIVFLCVGLGGGTGSGAAPIITRIAREEGAFVVVFATMPFGFEGRRRREQAESCLNELAVLSNALVTFDNNRMGELVLAKQGIHEAFSAADRMICESIKAVIRLVIRPGLINVGLDDLMSALRTNRSRCLFGSGLAKGKDRAAAALRNALASPLLDQGALLKDAETVLVHLCGGEDLTLYEVELLMQRLQKFVPDSAHVLFGAAIDPAMGEGLSVTLISALPEDALAAAPRDSVDPEEKSFLDPSESFTTAAAAEPSATEPAVTEPEPDAPAARPSPEPLSLAAGPTSLEVAAADIPRLFGDDLPFAESTGDPQPNTTAPPETDPPTAKPAPKFPPAAKPEPEPPLPEASEFPEAKIGPFTFKPAQRSPSAPRLWGKTAPHKQEPPTGDPFEDDLETGSATPTPEPPATDSPAPTKLKLGVKPSSSQNELALDSAPRGRFEGQTPNVVDGEDLDLPPFLRKKK